jgi:hypothetical protein
MPAVRLCEPVSPAIEPVCAMAERKLENGEQRLARQNLEFGHRPGTKSLKIAGQRLGHTSLTRRNVGGSPTPGTHDAETALAGCPGRIRTCRCRFRTSLLASFNPTSPANQITRAEVLGVLPNGRPNAAVRANAILGEIVETLARGDRVGLHGFGTFSVGNRRAVGAALGRIRHVSLPSRRTSSTFRRRGNRELP